MVVIILFSSILSQVENGNGLFKPLFDCQKRE
jgi:hypothetical protein